jgi:transposase
VRPQGSPEELERRRLRAIGLLKGGYQPVDVAHMLGVDRRSVRRWNASHRHEGTQALRARPAPGRPPKLNREAKEKLERALLKGAKAAGFPTDLWTCPRVAQFIRSRFGVNYHVDHIGRLLHALGFSPQKPQRRAMERDEEKITQWVRHKWPCIKKKSPA